MVEVVPPSKEVPEGEELKRGLSWWLILPLAFASIMGSTMFFGAGIGAKFGGAASILAWVVLLPLTLYIATGFGELSAMFPKAGGIYEFCKQAYGRFPSFLVGWVGWIVGNLSTTLVVVAGLDYLLPQQEFALLKIGLSIAIMLLLNLIAFFGVEESGKVVLVLVVLCVSMVIAIVIFGITHFQVGNYTPFFGPVGALPILVAMFLLVESFAGWESVTYMAEETVNPKKNIPRALVWGTLLVGLCSMAVHVIALGVVRWESLLGSPAPLRMIFSVIFPANWDLWLRIGIFLTLVGSAAGGVTSVPRLLLAMARDKLFLTQFAVVHPKFKTPYKAIILQAIASVFIIGLTIGHFERLLSLFVPLALILYTVTMLAVPVLRKRLPDMERPFKMPFGSVGPYFIGLIFIGLIVVWITIEPQALTMLALGGSFVLFGLPLYLLIELYYDPKMITSVRDLTAHLELLTEKLFFPKKIQNEIFAWLGDLKGKFVLEFGCGVGTLTVKLAEKVGPEGAVYATDLSLNNLKIAKKRIEREMWRSHELIHGTVHVLHDEKHMERVHPHVTYADAIVSFGMLSYIQDIERVLKEMYALLPETGRICFVEYVDYFKLLPNPEWLEDNAEIEKIFRKAGFSVHVMRKKSLFWNYVFLYGLKLKDNVPVV